MSPSDVIMGATAFAVALILFWLYRDARARDANPTLWVACLALFALFVHVLLVPLGLIVYLFVRPKGRLDRCPNCGVAYLHWLAECPKCENRLKKDCHRCHAAVPIKSDRCPECGAPL